MDNQKIQSNCPVCGNTIYLDNVGNGDKCTNCGWDHSGMHEEFPDRVMCPNLISLNKARILYKEGKPFTPDFDDFIDGYNFYGEMEFTYNGVTYGLVRSENKGVEFWGMNTDKYETFKDIEEFEQKAQIDGKLVKDIWNEVENANWLQ